MSDSKQASFQFNNLLIKESHFVLNSAGEYDFTLSILPSGTVFPASNRFQLQLIIEAVDKDGKAEIKVVALAFFLYADIEDISTTPFFTENAPALVFPYVRAYISTLTTQSGIPPIILPTLNLSSLSGLLRQNIITSEELIGE